MAHVLWRFVGVYEDFPKFEVPFLGVLLVFGGLYWVPLFWETTI